MAGEVSSAQSDRAGNGSRLNVGAISPGFESNDLGFQPQADSGSSANANFSLGHFDTDRVTRERAVEFQSRCGRLEKLGGEQQVDGWEVPGSATFLNYWGSPGQRSRIAANAGQSLDPWRPARGGTGNNRWQL